MPNTLIEKILASHAGRAVRPGDIVDIRIDARIARDFGGANVVKNLVDNGLGVADPARTFFTFDCNPGGSDQNYASNQHKCRQFARERGIRVFDIDSGIGTHIAIDAGLCGPGDTLVSTDSHANILGAIGAFGQGMGDQDIAHAFAHGYVWFKVPPTVRVRLEGMPSRTATPKDVTFALLRHFGANGLLGYAAELYGPYIDQLDLAGRVTIASMGTEMGAIILLFPPNQSVIEHCQQAMGHRLSAGGVAGQPARDVAAGAPAGRSSAAAEAPQRSTRGSAATAVYADADAEYAQNVTINIDGLGPMIARPGHPEDVIPAAEVAGTKVDSVFIGSCTNGRYEDLLAAARVLEGNRVAPGLVLKIVPATDAAWRRLLDEGVLKVFKEAGALVGNAGCGGCAAGQIGQNGPGEVTVSTGNRNFPGKQGKGSVFLASPQTAAATALAGVIATVDAIPARPVAADPAARYVAADPRVGRSGEPAPASDVAAGLRTGRSSEPAPVVAAGAAAHPVAAGASPAGPPVAADLPVGRPGKPTTVKGRVWVIRQDNIDTDMIFHNRYLTITDIKQMGQYAFDNLKGWEDFAKKVRPGDIVVTGKNFGCGSSRQQAVDCFTSLGVAALIAESFGAIYERNAINAGLPIMCAPATTADLRDGEEVEVDFTAGTLRRSDGTTIQGTPMSDAQLAIYHRGGLLVKA